MGLPRYIASAGLFDVERMAAMALDLADAPTSGPVVLVQCGRESSVVAEVAKALQARGQRSKLLLIDDRDVARSEQMLGSLDVACGAWVFADNLLFLNRRGIFEYLIHSESDILLHCQPR